MGLKNARLISLFALVMIFLIRTLTGPLVPEDLSIVTEDKIYVIEAGEPWGLYFKHEALHHPYLDPEAIAAIRLENQDIGVELSVRDVTHHDDLGLFGITYFRISHPFSSIETPLLLTDPRLTFWMIDGQTLHFQFSYVGFFPEREQRSKLQFVEIYGLYQPEKLGLQGLYLTLHNPTADDVCLSRVNLGLATDIPLTRLYQTASPFTPHQPGDDYHRTPFNGCIPPFHSVSLLIDQALDKVLESVVITLEIKTGENAYLNPIRLVRNIPFHHDLKRIQGVFND